MLGYTVQYKTFVCVRERHVQYMSFCAWMGMFLQVAIIKRSKKQERRKMAEDEKDVLMNECKEQESCKMATRIASVAQQQQSTELTEAH